MLGSSRHVVVAQRNPAASNANRNVNPFFYDEPVECCSKFLQRCKMLCVGLTLFPLRVIALVLSLLVAWLLCKAMTLCVDSAAIDKRPLRAPMLRFMFRKCARIFLWSLGFWWVTRRGTENIQLPLREALRRMQETADAEANLLQDPATRDALVKKKRDILDAVERLCTRNGAVPVEDAVYHAPLLVGNHVSLVDTVYLAAYHDFMAVGKVELLDVPLFGGICKALQYIPVKRESAESRKTVSREICRRTRVTDTAAEAVDGGPWQPLVIFPEATCTNTASIIQFKVGAFVPGAPVQPFTLAYPYKHFTQAWVGASTLGGQTVKSMLQVYNTLHVTYLPIHFPSSAEQADAGIYAEAVRQDIAATLGVPTTDHTFEDVQLINEANALQVPLPLSAINVAMGLPENQSVGIQRAKQKLREFAALDADQDGYLNRAEFGVFLGLGVDSPADSLTRDASHGNVLDASNDVSSSDVRRRQAANLALRDAIFDRWKTVRHHQPELEAHRHRPQGEEVVDFASFLACTAAQKIRIRNRRKVVEEAPTIEGSEGEQVVVLVGAHTGATLPSSNHDMKAAGGSATPVDHDVASQASFFLEEARDEELLFCMTLCFGAFDADHDGFISEAEFRRGMQLVCPALVAGSSTAGDAADASPNRKASMRAVPQSAPLVVTNGWVDAAVDEHNNPVQAAATVGTSPDAGGVESNSPPLFRSRSAQLSTRAPSDSFAIEDTIEALFDGVDADNDGKLSLDEFVAFARVHPLFLHHLITTIGTDMF